MRPATREQQKDLRRRAILDAARALMLEDQSRDFSMPRLAERAGVSLVTPYNLLGSKSNILLAIVREDIFGPLGAIDEAPCEEVTRWLAEAAAILARIYYAKRHFYRRLIVALTAQEDAEVQRESLELSYRVFEPALAQLTGQGALLSAVPVRLLAQTLAHAVAGALQRRLMERGSQAGLARDLELALGLVLGGVCPEPDRPRLLARLAQLADDAD